MKRSISLKVLPWLNTPTHSKPSLLNVTLWNYHSLILSPLSPSQPVLLCRREQDSALAQQLLTVSQHHAKHSTSSPFMEFYLKEQGSPNQAIICLRFLELSLGRCISHYFISCSDVSTDWNNIQSVLMSFVGQKWEHAESSSSNANS